MTRLARSLKEHIFGSDKNRIVPIGFTEVKPCHGGFC